MEFTDDLLRLKQKWGVEIIGKVDHSRVRFLSIIIVFLILQYNACHQGLVYMPLMPQYNLPARFCIKREENFHTQSHHGRSSNRSCKLNNSHAKLILSFTLKTVMYWFSFHAPLALVQPADRTHYQLPESTKLFHVSFSVIGHCI